MVPVSKSTLYFAYGSNMSLNQMADRCPSSIFKGKGRLSGYRWQINERGVGNIIESRNNYVEGVVYEIDKDNRRQLDKNEGIGRGYYNAEYLPIQFTPLQDQDLKTRYVAKNLETMTIPRQDVEQERAGVQTCLQGHASSSSFNSQPSNKMSYQRNKESPQTANLASAASDSVVLQVKNPTLCVDDTISAASEKAGEDHAKTIDALVYISRNYKTDGKIRMEYIPRMEKAIIDGQKLELSRHFLGQIEGCIHRPPSPPQQRQSTQKSNEEAQNLQGIPGAFPLQQSDSHRGQQGGTPEDRST